MWRKFLEWNRWILNNKGVVGIGDIASIISAITGVGSLATQFFGGGGQGDSISNFQRDIQGAEQRRRNIARLRALEQLRIGEERAIGFGIPAAREEIGARNVLGSSIEDDKLKRVMGDITSKFSLARAGVEERFGGQTPFFAQPEAGGSGLPGTLASISGLAGGFARQASTDRFLESLTKDFGDGGDEAATTLSNINTARARNANLLTDPNPSFT